MEEERKLKQVRKSPLAILADAERKVEKIRVLCEVRLAHLARFERTCKDTETLLSYIRPVEEWVDGRMSELIEDHPAQWWFSHIKGIGKENIAKCIASIERFGRYYPEGDPEIPPEVKRAAEDYVVLDENGNVVEKRGIWVEGIERLSMPSKQRIFIGHYPGAKRKRGEKLPYSADAKTLFWRVGESLTRAGGSYYHYYLQYKDYLNQRETAAGKKVVPTPKERYCTHCDKDVVKKAAKYCPDCGEILSQKEEAPDVIHLGHLHMMARRKMQQLFSDHLNVVWRQALGLSTREPYPIERLGHNTIIRPEDMMDKKCGKKDCPICEKYGLQ